MTLAMVVVTMRITVHCKCVFCSNEGDGHVDVEQRSNRQAQIDGEVTLPGGWTWHEWYDSPGHDPLCPACTEKRA